MIRPKILIEVSNWYEMSKVKRYVPRSIEDGDEVGG